MSAITTASKDLHNILEFLNWLQKTQCLPRVFFSVALFAHFTQGCFNLDEVCWEVVIIYFVFKVFIDLRCSFLNRTLFELRNPLFDFIRSINSINYCITMSPVL